MKRKSFWKSGIVAVLSCTALSLTLWHQSIAFQAPCLCGLFMQGLLSQRKDSTGIPVFTQSRGCDVFRPVCFHRWEEEQVAPSGLSGDQRGSLCLCS